MKENAHDFADPSRGIARIAHALLAEEQFSSLADFTDALKFKLVRLRIRYTNENLNNAYRIVEMARPLPGAPTRCVLVEREPEPAPDLPKTDAAKLWAALRARAKTVTSGTPREVSIRTMPTATWSDPDSAAREHQAARERAWEMGIELED